MSALLDADRRLYLLLHSRLRADWVDPIMIWFTKAGTKGVIWLGLAAGLLVEASLRGRAAALLSVGALLVAEGLINIILKPAIGRERPFTRPGFSALLVKAPGAHSWPSAHAGSSMAAATVLAVAYPWLGAIFVAVALLIGYSRIYVGVHYPLDVISGIIAGLLSAGAVLLLGVLLSPLLHLPVIA